MTKYFEEVKQILSKFFLCYEKDHIKKLCITSKSPNENWWNQAPLDFLGIFIWGLWGYTCPSPPMISLPWFPEQHENEANFLFSFVQKHSKKTKNDFCFHFFLSWQSTRTPGKIAHSVSFHSYYYCDLLLTLLWLIHFSNT